MLATLISFALFSFGSCSTCATTGRDVRLCAAHAAEERAVLGREGLRLGSKDLATQIAALDALAALTEAHANAPSAQVAERIASALDDTSFELQTHAASLLGPPQHAVISLEALVEALAHAKKEQLPLNVEYDALNGKLAGKLQDKRRAELRAALKSCDDRRVALGRWRHFLVARLALFKDDRSVDAILAHTFRNLLSGDGDTLLLLGNRNAVRALIESFSACDRDLMNADKQLAEQKSARKDQSRTLGDALAEVAVENMHKASTAARQALITSFAARGLTAPAADADSATWKKWIEQNLESFPDHLPGITSPAW